jgi:antitoxin HicB
MADIKQFTVVLEPQPDGGYTATVPALPEVVTEGDTEEEALRMAADAVRLVLSYRRDHGLPVPADSAPCIRHITIAA